MSLKKRKEIMKDTPEEALLRKQLLVPCSSKEHLRYWFLTFLNVDLVDCHVSRFSNSDPLSACWDLYCRALYYSGDDPYRVLHIAARSTQKTLMFSCLEAILLLHDKNPILHYAVTLDQAEVAWNYLKEFFNRKFLRDLVVGKPTADKLTVRIPSITNPAEDPIEITSKIFSLTLNQIQGQHSARLFVDEIHALMHDKRRFYTVDLAGVPDSTRDGKPYIRSSISTRRGAYSVIEEEISKAHETGLEIKIWNILDVTEKCLPSRSGTLPTKYYGSPYLATTVTSEQFDELHPNEKHKFFEATGGENCPKCSISNFCLSSLMNQKSESSALKSIAKLISDYKANNLDFFLSQALSLMPSSEGVVYNKFKKELHVKGYNDIWHIVTGENATFPINIHQLIQRLEKEKYTIYAGLDHSGGSSPATIVVGAFSPDLQKIIILESWAENGVDIEELSVHLKRLQTLYKFYTIYPDPSAVDKNKLLSKKGFKLFTNFKREIGAGIEMVKSKLMAADGSIKMYLLDDRTGPLQEEFQKYHYKQESDASFSESPEDEYDHCLDALRYLLQNIFGKYGKVLAPEMTNQEKDLFKKEMIGQTNIEEWLQQQINEAINKNAQELGVEPEGSQYGQNPSGSLKWFV